jgi:nicotinate-nucleotide adenylyltransferase
VRVGVFGGSFDPVHIGHLVVAECARDALSLAHVLLIPARVPPHKPDRVLASAEHRAEMLRRAAAGNAAFEICRIELDAPGPSYTVTTLRSLRQHYGDAVELFLILGQDSLRELPTWQEPHALRQLARLAVAPRPGVLHEPPPEVAVIPSPEVAVSASDIRARVAEGRSIRYIVPDDVREYIHQHGLYRVS